MRKTIAAATLLLSAITFSSCAAFGFDNNSMPVIAIHSGEDVSTQSSSGGFIRLPGLESSDKESSAIIDTTSETPSEQSTGGESEEPDTSAPQPHVPYKYDGFVVCGFEQSEVEDVISDIKKEIDAASAHVSLYYLDIKTGHYISYDARRSYKAGSVTKAPYAKYLIESGVDLDEVLTMQSSDKEDGSGSLKNQPAGSKYKVSELIDKAVRESDNTAYKMLYKRFGFDGFNDYAASLDTTVRLAYSDVWGNLCAEDAAKLFADMYDFEKEMPEADFFMSSLKNATYVYLLPSGLGTTPVAHKYGYMSGAYKVLHDVGIVYASNPYVIAVMTDYNPPGGNGRKTFTQISRHIKGFADLQ